MWLALRLGSPHVDDVLDTITPEEFREWLAYWVLNGEGRQWRNHAETMAEIINLPIRYAGMKAGKDTRSMRVLAEDILPKLFQPEVERTEDENQSEQIKQLARHLGCI